MEENNEITMKQLLCAVNNLTIIVNDLKHENGLLKDNTKIVKENEEKKETKLVFLNRTNKNLNNNYLYVFENIIINDEFIKETNELNNFYEVFKFYLNNICSDYFNKNDITWIYHEDTSRLYVYDKSKNRWKQLGFNDLKLIINNLRNNINFAFINWANKQDINQNEQFKLMYIRCCERYYYNELTTNEYNNMKHLLYKYLKNMN